MKQDTPFDLCIHLQIYVVCLSVCVCVCKTGCMFIEGLLHVPFVYNLHLFICIYPESGTIIYKRMWKRTLVCVCPPPPYIKSRCLFVCVYVSVVSE